MADEAAALLGDAQAAALLGDSVEEVYDRARSRALSPEKAQALRHARWCVYASQFLHKVAWGAYSVVSPFYLALFMSTAAAANVATAEWAAYSVGQVLCTSILGAATDQAGRRPVFVVCQATIFVVFLVLFWPNLYWWAVTGFVQGCFSCTWAVSITILIDCVSNGAPPGGDDDILLMRVFRKIATPAADETGEVRQELAVAVTALWFVAGAGQVCGYAVGYGLWALFPAWLAITSCGFFQLLGSLIVWAYLPETAPDASKTFDSNEAVEAARAAVQAQTQAVAMVLRDTRSTYLTASYVLQYFALTGVTNLCVFWGQAKYDWSAQSAAVYLAVFTISPGVGALIGSRLLYPSSLRYAKSIALMLFSAAVGCTLEGLASPTVSSAIGLSVFATAGGGVYPAILALLTPDVAPGKQGHLQGALYAIATLGSVAALGVYLALFNTTESFLDGAPIWLLSAAFFVFAAGFAYAAGERVAIERGQAKHPVTPPRRWAGA